MSIQLTKRNDGGAVLRCVRADGTVTWQTQRGRSAMFFPLHDLTHYAVETELAFRHGFFGLVADGWEIDQTTGKSPRGPLPPEALAVEHLVGQLDLERASGTPWTAAELNMHAAEHLRQRAPGAPPPRELTEAELARLRARWHDLLDRWAKLPPGQTLELTFDRP